MALDGLFLSAVRRELSDAVDSHVDKIYQPSKDTLVFLLRGKTGARRLLCTAAVGAARLQFTRQKPENPQNPPMFCMLLRKHLSTARLIEIRQEGTERVLTLVFSGVNETGDTIRFSLICELLSGQTNLIFAQENGKILDAVRRSDLLKDERVIQPGAIYTPVAGLAKLDPLFTPAETILSEMMKRGDMPLHKAILNTVAGFSPLLSRELAFRAVKDPDLAASDLTERQQEAFVQAFRDVMNYAAHPQPTVVYKEDGTPLEFSFLPLTQYPQQFPVGSFSTLSESLDAFFGGREAAARIRHAGQDLIRHIHVLIGRTRKKMAARVQEEKDCENREELRIAGELIKANLYRLSPGQSECTLENYYDSEGKSLRIRLNPALSPAANADRYFKEYKKSCTKVHTLAGLIEQDRRDLAYYECVLDSLSRADSLSELSQIRAELVQGGILKTAKGQKVKETPAAFREYRSAEGYRIAVGRNNRQNDLLTLKTAAKNDLWFHVKDAPGSHVVVFCGGGTVSEETMLMAARLAATHSSLSAADKVPVDYTVVKYVKKPSGARPGMVIYTNQKTLTVSPERTPLPGLV